MDPEHVQTAFYVETLQTPLALQWKPLPDVWEFKTSYALGIEHIHRERSVSRLGLGPGLVL
jgi:hypothetical protein